MSMLTMISKVAFALSLAAVATGCATSTEGDDQQAQSADEAAIRSGGIDVPYGMQSTKNYQRTEFDLVVCSCTNVCAPGVGVLATFQAHATAATKAALRAAGGCKANSPFTSATCGQNGDGTYTLSVTCNQ